MTPLLAAQHLSLSTLDWIIIVVYLIGCMAAGIWMRRYVKGVEDFAVAGREMNVNLGIASLAATELGVITVMYAAQAGFQKGFAGATIGLIMATAMFFVGKTGFIIGPLRNAGVMTIPELFQKRFGTRVRWLAGLVVIIGGLLNMGVFLKVGGKFLIHVSGAENISLEWAMTGLLALILIYTVLGGMLSVLITDYLQFLVMGLGIVVISVLIIKDWGWVNLTTMLWVCWDGSGTAGQTLKSHPYNPFDPTSWGWQFLLWQVLLQLAAVTTWQPNVSRILSAKDEETAKRVYTRSAFYFVGRWALPVLWGVGALLYFTQKGIKPDDSLTAMPLYLAKLLPAGILGIVIAAMLAAEMSTDSGYMLTWATVIYNDLVMPCVKRPLTAKQQLLITRGIVLAIGAFLVVWGLWYEPPGDVWSYLSLTGQIYFGSIFTLLVAALYWPRANRVGALAAIVLGAIGPIASVIAGILIKKQVLPPTTAIPEAVAGVSSFVLAGAGMVLGSMLASPKSKEGNAQ